MKKEIDFDNEEEVKIISEELLFKKANSKIDELDSEIKDRTGWNALPRSTQNPQELQQELMKNLKRHYDLIKMLAIPLPDINQSIVKITQYELD